MIILSGVYRTLVSTGDRIIPAGLKSFIKWEHPAGPKTIHFWAPFMKWVSDFIFNLVFAYKNFLKLFFIL